MEKLFSTAFPKTLLFYCIITGLIRVKRCFLSGTSCFFLVLQMRFEQHISVLDSASLFQPPSMSCVQPVVGFKSVTGKIIIFVSYRQNIYMDI